MVIQKRTSNLKFILYNQNPKTPKPQNPLGYDFVLNSLIFVYLFKLTLSL